MPKRAVLWLLCLSVLPSALAQSSLPARETNAAIIRAEIGRVQEQLRALKLSTAEEESLSAVLQRSERAVQAGHLFLSLHLLQNVAPTLAGYDFARASKAGATFEQEWRQRGAELTARQRKLTIPPRLPRVLQAIMERSLTQVQPNYQASLLYGQETSVESGLFYLGLARGHQDFVAFCRQIPFAAPTVAPVPAPAAELAALEAEVLAAYQQFDTPEQHSGFIRVNSALKIAQDLARERRASGVWLQVLEARRALVAILVKDAENRSAADLRQQSETMHAQLSKSNGDHSLGWLYWQMAEAALAMDDLKQANAILHHVLPRYFQAFTRNIK